MRNDTRSAQVQQIVEQLCTLPGGRNLDIVAKKWPRVGPAETGSAYQVVRRSYAVQQLPQSVSVPDDSEEIVIRLRGEVEPPQVKDALVEELYAFFAADEMREHWDLRTRFEHAQDVGNAYELTVLSHLAPATQTPLDLA